MAEHAHDKHAFPDPLAGGFVARSGGGIRLIPIPWFLVASEVSGLTRRSLPAGICTASIPIMHNRD